MHGAHGLLRTGAWKNQIGILSEASDDMATRHGGDMITYLEPVFSLGRGRYKAVVVVMLEGIFSNLIDRYEVEESLCMGAFEVHEEKRRERGRTERSDQGKAPWHGAYTSNRDQRLSRRPPYTI